MGATSEFDSWQEAQDFQLPLDGKGRIIDFLDANRVRENKPEERVRQKTAHILHGELGYPKSHIAFERTINIGRDRTRADIIVYTSSDACLKNDQGRVLLVGEIKAPTEHEPDGQITGYISATSAQGGFWTNGNKIYFYRKNPHNNAIIEWIGLPKHKHAWDSIGNYKKSDLITPVDLKLAFRRCHNAIYRLGIDSEDVALDMVRIILSKVEDESSARENCEFFITPSEYATEHGKSRAAHRIRSLFSTVRDRYPDVFSKSEEISASDNALAVVVSQLQQYAFLDAPHDVIGTAYEVYVASHLKGERGQFFTNRLVVEMMVRMLDPDDKDTILDPACGSGGFLLSCMHYVFRKIENSRRTATAKEILKRNVVHQIFGVDISPKLVKIAKANMLIGQDGHGGIERGNSLDALDKLSPKFRSQAGIEMPSMILTNPPFGSGHELRIKEPTILQQFDNGYAWAVQENNVVYDQRLNTRQGVAPEVLFLERCLSWVKPGGVVGIVMAKGQLDNREAYAMRHTLLEKAQILAIVNLHEDTFEPFCGSKASVVFFKRKEAFREISYRIFMAISNKIGQTSRGEPIFRKDSEGNPVRANGHIQIDEDATDIAEDFHAFCRGELNESAYRFSIRSNDIRVDTLSLNPIQYLPQHNEAVEHVLRLCDSDDFELHRLGDLARVFNGPRFKRPYADLGVSTGPTIRKYFTGTALTQLNAENVKHLDSAKANTQTQKHLDTLTIYKGYILISDSGTLGRVTYALEQHDGHVATNNLIRVIIEDANLRGYVYQFLKSDLGQKLMLKNAYGTNQEHLEPDVISDVPVPVPANREVIDAIGSKVLASIDELEKSLEHGRSAESELDDTLQTAPDPA